MIVRGYVYDRKDKRKDKNYLEQIHRSEVLIKHMQNKIDRLRDKARNTPTSHISYTLVKSSGNIHAVALEEYYNVNLKEVST